MPLGKLSKNHLMEGYKVLTEIQELIKLGNAPKAKFVGTSIPSRVNRLIN